MASIKVKRVIGVPPADVWAVISGLENAGRWNKHWTRIEFTSEARTGSGVSFRAHTDEGHQFDFRVTGWVDEEYLEITPIRDASERYGIMLESQAFRLKPMDEGSTQIELVANASTHGLRSWVIGTFFWPGHQAGGLAAALDAIQDILEPPEETVEVEVLESE